MSSYKVTISYATSHQRTNTHAHAHTGAHTNPHLHPLTHARTRARTHLAAGAKHSLVEDAAPSSRPFSTSHSATPLPALSLVQLRILILRNLAGLLPPSQVCVSLLLQLLLLLLLLLLLQVLRLQLQSLAALKDGLCHDCRLRNASLALCHSQPAPARCAHAVQAVELPCCGVGAVCFDGRTVSRK